MAKIISKKLKGLMAEHEITVRELSNIINVSERSLSLKINGRRDWYYRELIFITKQLGFSEIKDVFPELYDYILKAG